MSLTHKGKLFGLGLIGIGRPWGHVPGQVPEESEARSFLEFAFQAGVRYFDTAPSYGLSEGRLGRFLASLSTAERSSVTVATKFGEHWDSARSQPFVDHRFEALSRSLEQSARRLGRIDVLQLHKTTPEVLRSADLERAWELAAAYRIQQLGPSASDLDSVSVACASGRFQMIQLPLNRTDGRFIDVLRAIKAAGLWVAANRPFAMGRMVVETQGIDPGEAKIEALRYLLELPFSGVILSGTKSKQHLAENLEAFQTARKTETP